MKRPLPALVLKALLALAALAARPAPGWAEVSPLAWAAALREADGLPLLEEDEALSVAARRWAAVLAGAGVLSHHGADGSTALDRYRDAGGTAARVAEILGAGPGPAEVQRAWEASPPHRAAVLGSRWTHAGWGRAPRAGGGWVYVVLFCQELAAHLRIEEDADGARVSGTFVPADARAAVLLSGIESVAARAWDPGRRAFEFRLGPTEARGYFRLGYEDGAGLFVLTDAFTLPRGTGSPGATGRFEEPAAPP